MINGLYGSYYRWKIRTDAKIGLSITNSSSAFFEIYRFCICWQWKAWRCLALTKSSKLQSICSIKWWKNPGKSALEKLSTPKCRLLSPYIYSNGSVNVSIVAHIFFRIARAVASLYIDCMHSALLILATQRKSWRKLGGKLSENLSESTWSLLKKICWFILWKFHVEKS